MHIEYKSPSPHLDVALTGVSLGYGELQRFVKGVIHLATKIRIIRTLDIKMTKNTV